MGYVILVARDVGPTRALQRVSRLATETFRGSICVLGDGKPLPNSHQEIPGFVVGSDLVLTGMSSSAELAQEELAACEAAVKNGVPLALFADTFRAWARPWFEPYREAASALFVVSPAEAEKARELFPNAKIVASGNPVWEDFFFPKYTREEVRQRLHVVGNYCMILVPGSKCLGQNMLLFGGVIDAANLAPKIRPEVYLSLHPADPNPAEIYDDLIKYSAIPVQRVPKEVFSGSELVSGCDVVVQSGSTIGVEAACQRKPVVEYANYVVFGNWERQTGSREYPLVGMQAAEQIYADPVELSHLLKVFRPGGGRLWNQEKVFPKPAERGAAVKAIVSTLRELTS